MAIDYEALGKAETVILSALGHCSPYASPPLLKDRIILVDHTVDLIGNGLCQFVIVPGIVTVDCDIHTAKVGRPGRTASGQSCLWEVPART